RYQRLLEAFRRAESFARRVGNRASKAARYSARLVCQIAGEDAEADSVHRSRLPLRRWHGFSSVGAQRAESVAQPRFTGALLRGVFEGFRPRAGYRRYLLVGRMSARRMGH